MELPAGQRQLTSRVTCSSLIFPVKNRKREHKAQVPAQDLLRAWTIGIWPDPSAPSMETKTLSSRIGDCFDLVSIRITNEGAIVVRIVVFADARRAVICSTGC